MNSSLFKSDVDLPEVTVTSQGQGQSQGQAPKGDFWGSALPAIGDVIGAGLNLISQGWTQRYNTSEANKARDFNREMWNANNAYNTPAQQMARLRAAGLNPNLMYGLPSSQAQLASSGAQASSSPQHYNIDSIANIQSLINQTKLTEAQIANMQADTTKKTVEAENISSSTSKIRSETSNLEKYAEQLNLQNEFTRRNLENSLKQAVQNTSFTENQVKLAAQELGFRDKNNQNIFNLTEEEAKEAKLQNEKLGIDIESYKKTYQSEAGSQINSILQVLERLFKLAK